MDNEKIVIRIRLTTFNYSCNGDRDFLNFFAARAECLILNVDHA